MGFVLFFSISMAYYRFNNFASPFHPTYNELKSFLNYYSLSMYIVISQGSIEGRSTWPKQAPDWNIQQTDASTRPKPAPGRSTSTRHQYKAPCRSNLQNTRIRLKYSVKGFDLLLWLQKLYPKKLEEGLAVNISLEKWFSPPFLSINKNQA